MIFGNEVLDALPCERFLWSKGQFFQNFVGLDHDDYVSLWFPTDPLPLSFPGDGPYVSEHRPSLKAWLEPWMQSLRRGAVCWIDYGYAAREYYHPERSNGTLRCFYQQQAHDNPFVHVGKQDITAHVDFTALAQAHYECGLAIEGFCTLAHFLMNCDILSLLDNENLDSAVYQQRQQAKMLLLASEMGETFKCFAARKNLEGPLTGFQAFNGLHRL